MPRIKPLENHEVDDATATTLEAVGKKLGMVPNLFATLAHSPAALNSFLSYSQSISAGTLSAKQREMIALAVAQFNQCQYCLSAHSMMGKDAGLSAEDISKARSASASEAIDNAIAAFAIEVTKSNGVLQDDTFDAAIRDGLTHSLMVEIVANVALNLLTNYINHLADTEIDFPIVDLKPAAAA